MSRIISTGFENGNLNHPMISAYSGASVISTSGLDMDGNYCLELSGQNDYCSFSVTADDEYYVSYFFRHIMTTSSECTLLIWKNGSTILGGLALTETDRIIRAFTGTDTLVQTSAIALNSNTTYLIRAYIKIADSGGRILVTVNGITAIDFTGDTKPGADTQMNLIFFGRSSELSGSCSAYQYIDNLIIDTAAFPVGNPKIQGKPVNGAGTTNTFTSGAYTDVDEVPADGAAGLITNTVGHIFTGTKAALSGSVASINAVTVYGVALASGNPTPKNIQLGVRSGGTDYFATDKLVPFVTAQALNRIMEVDPDTSAAWTESGLNNAEIGIKSVA
jgi:hypothetical protein